MKLRTRRKQAAESPLGSTDAIGRLEQLARIASDAGNSPRRRTERPCESNLMLGPTMQVMAQHSIAWHSTAQHRTAQHSTAHRRIS